MPTANRLRRTAILVAAVLVASAGVAGPGRPPSAVRADELSEARSARRALEADIAAQEALVARLRATQAGIRARIAETSASLRATVSDLEEVKRDLAALRTELDRVQQDFESLVTEVGKLERGVVQAEQQEAAKRDALRERKALLADRIRAAYDAQQRSPFEALLSGASFTDMLVAASAQLDAAEQDRALAEQIAADRAALAVLLSNLRARRAQADQMRQEAAVQRRALDLQIREVREAEARLERLERDARRILAKQRAAYERAARDKARAAAAVAAGERAQERLAQRIRRLVERRQEGIPSAFSGTMQWPMRGTVSQDYGCTGFAWEPPRGDCPNFHSGIDIVAPYGTPVRAAADGRVVFVGYNPYDPPGDPAWIVIIAHSSSVQTWYAHLQARRPVAAGDLVRAGQVIGYEGNTGRSTGAHLDWRVMRNGEFVNPRLFL